MKRLLIYLGIPIALFLVIGMLFSSRPTEKSYVYSDIVSYFEDQQVTAFSINMGTGEMRLQLDDEENSQPQYHQHRQHTHKPGSLRRPLYVAFHPRIARMVSIVFIYIGLNLLQQVC